MAGPWEKFKAKKEEAPAAGPWQKYAQEPPEEPGAEEDFIGTKAVMQESVRRRPKNASEARAMLRAIPAAITQAVTAGHTPEIVGKITSKISDRPYVEVRDEQAREMEDIRKGAPWTHAVANLGTSMLLPIKAAKGLPGAIGIGAAQGFAQNPGNEEGVVDPLQLGRRSVGAGLGATFSGGANVLGRGLGAAGRAFLVKRAMQKPFFSKMLGEEVDLAGQELSKNYITPRAKAARETLKGKTIKVNPNAFDGADEPGLQAALRKRTGRAQKEAANASMAGMGTKADVQPGDEMATLRGDVADRVRRKLEHKAYKNKTAFANPESLASAEGKTRAASVIRDERNRVAPELAQNFDEQSYALGLLNDVKKGSGSPQTMMNSAGDMESKLIDFDHLTGTTNLTRTGKDLKAANYLTGRSERAGLSSGLNAGERGAANVAAALSSPVAVAQRMSERHAPEMLKRKLSPATLRMLLERAMSSPRYPEDEEEQ